MLSEMRRWAIIDLCTAPLLITVNIYVLVVISSRQGLVEVDCEECLVAVIFSVSLSARRSYSVSQAEEQSLLESRQKSRMIILQKPDAVIDGQQWVEAVRSHRVSVTVPHNHYGKVTPNHFNDVPILGQDDPDSRKL